MKSKPTLPEKTPTPPATSWPRRRFVSARAWWRAALWCCCCALVSGAQAQNGNTLPTAYPLGSLTSTLTRTGHVDNASPADFYQFVIAGSVRAVTALIPANFLTAGIELRLLRDTNNNGNGEVLVSDVGSQGTSGDGLVSMWLDPGTYYVEVRQVGTGANTDYHLTLSQMAHSESPGDNDNTSATARFLNIGHLTNDFVGINDVVDYYQFDVVGQVAKVTAEVLETSLTAGIDLSLLRRDGNADVVLASDCGRLGGICGDATVFLWLDPGTYFVRVESPGGMVNSLYGLQLYQTPHPESPGTNDNQLTTARLLVPRVLTNDFVGINDAVDYYRFDLTATNDVVAEIRADTLSYSIGIVLSLIRLANNGSEVVMASDPGRLGGRDGDAFVSVPQLGAGTYYVKVEQQDGGIAHTEYTLALGLTPNEVPVIGLSGDLAFGNVDVGSNAIRSLTIHNMGSATLNVSGITNPIGFSGAFSGAIAAGGSTNVTVTFAPVAPITYTGTVSVNSDAASGISVMPISGRGATRIIALSSLVNFGNVESRQRTNRNLAITNLGNVSLTVSGITFPEGFSGSYTGAIPPNSFTNVPVTFAPTNVTSYGGMAEVISDRTAGANTTTLSGTGTVVLARTIRLTGNLNFGGVESGRSSHRELVITNPGKAPFTVSRIEYPGGFDYSSNYTGLVAPNQSRTVMVWFHPQDTNVIYDGEVKVFSDANGGTNTIRATGSGTPILSRVIELGGDLAFGEVQARSNAMRVLFITNSGAAALDVSNITYPAGFSGAFRDVIPPGERRQVTVKFAPPAAGNYGGELTVHADHNAGINTRAVSGTGTPAPLRPVVGNYQGVFHQTDAVRHESSGFFTLTAPGKAGVKYRASYTAKILLAGQKLGASGKFDFNGHATNVITRKGKDTLRVEWHADPQGGDTITGRIVAPYWEAALLGHRAVYASKTNDAPPADTYTMIFAGIPGADDSPQGDGFGTVSVSERGVITLVAMLADGAKVTQSANLSRQGDWPLYVNLYQSRGSLLGKLLFASSGEEDLGGRASWIRPAIAKSIYPNGFEVDSETTGSRYRAPAGKTNRVVAITNALVSFTGGNLVPPVSCPVLLTATNKVISQGPHALTMTITKSNGLFSGSITLNGTRNKIQFQGVFLQRTNSAGYGAGYFLREKLSGRVEFRAAP